MREYILYHGSKGGIKGEITPSSRSRCDFGRAFYMGENKRQAASLVVNDSRAFLYTVRLTVADDAKVLQLKDTDWLYAVLANRGHSREFNALQLSAYWKKKVSSYDLVIGKIADDKMNQAVEDFIGSVITDQGLIFCLEKVTYGNQFAAKTKKMCSSIEILEKTPINEVTFPDLREYMRERQKEYKNVILEARRRYRGKGMYFDEILEREEKQDDRSGL